MLFKTIFLVVIGITFTYNLCRAQQPYICTPQDSVLIERQLDRHKEENNKTTPELIISVGKSLLNKPYVAQTLEKGEIETLIVNPSQFDCTTFVEHCLAMARTIRSNSHKFSDYTNQLRLIRYRNGTIDNYTSRLHYWSEWIINNQKKGIITDITQQSEGIIYANNISFMSTHSDKYPRLKGKKELINQIEKVEQDISSYEFFYIPKDDVLKTEKYFNDGDIIGITTNIKGLDFVHTGILIRKNQRIHLLHASSDKKKVVISQLPLHEYLAANKIQSGIMVLRAQ
ncbi:DUF1460 domain-containing protein [Puteibacter caeruleilacunae]|nr:DUF1460 domain-containing protein [Puteibacter caeruleilacunae]